MPIKVRLEANKPLKLSTQTAAVNPTRAHSSSSTQQPRERYTAILRHTAVLPGSSFPLLQLSFAADLPCSSPLQQISFAFSFAATLLCRSSPLQQFSFATQQSFDTATHKFSCSRTPTRQRQPRRDPRARSQEEEGHASVRVNQRQKMKVNQS